MNISLLPKIAPRTKEQRRSDMERQLIRKEAIIGGKLFGPVPKGHTRQFFCMDEHTWIWHEEWLNKGRRQFVTTRYDIRPNAIVKVQDGQPNRLASKEEAQNLYTAARLYQERVDLDHQQTLRAL